jgi:hypothetical protein
MVSEEGFEKVNIKQRDLGFDPSPGKKSSVSDCEKINEKQKDPN